MKRFVVEYYGLLENIKIAEVELEDIAQDMCYQHNKTVPRHWFDIGIGHMSYHEIPN